MLKNFLKTIFTIICIVFLIPWVITFNSIIKDYYAQIKVAPVAVDKSITNVLVVVPNKTRCSTQNIVSSYGLDAQETRLFEQYENPSKIKDLFNMVPKLKGAFVINKDAQYQIIDIDEFLGCTYKIIPVASIEKIDTLDYSASGALVSKPNNQDCEFRYEERNNGIALITSEKGKEIKKAGLFSYVLKKISQNSQNTEVLQEHILDFGHIKKTSIMEEVNSQETSCNASFIKRRFWTPRIIQEKVICFKNISEKCKNEDFSDADLKTKTLRTCTTLDITDGFSNFVTNVSNLAKIDKLVGKEKPFAKKEPECTSLTFDERTNVETFSFFKKDGECRLECYKKL